MGTEWEGTGSKWNDGVEFSKYVKSTAKRKKEKSANYGKLEGNSKRCIFFPCESLTHLFSFTPFLILTSFLLIFFSFHFLTSFSHFHVAVPFHSTAILKFPWWNSQRNFLYDEAAEMIRKLNKELTQTDPPPDHVGNNEWNRFGKSHVAFQTTWVGKYSGSMTTF